MNITHGAIHTLKITLTDDDILQAIVDMLNKDENIRHKLNGSLIKVDDINLDISSAGSLRGAEIYHKWEA